MNNIKTKLEAKFDAFLRHPDALDYLCMGGALVSMGAGFLLAVFGH